MLPSQSGIALSIVPYVTLSWKATRAAKQASQKSSQVRSSSLMGDSKISLVNSIFEKPCTAKFECKYVYPIMLASMLPTVTEVHCLQIP